VPEIKYEPTNVGGKNSILGMNSVGVLYINLGN
jgi:hypothetical protein